MSQDNVTPGYRRIRELGAGSAAVVWLVESGADGRQYALKVFHRTDSREDISAMGEAVLQADIEHEHLVRVHDVVDCDGSSGLLMDYAPGGSVAGLVAARGPLPAGEVITILTPIAQTLAYLHGRGVVHGDVAPPNVLLTAHGKPLLTDLGLSRVVGETRTRGLGTPGFVDPDDPGDSTQLRPESDVYALAAVGWYALTGRVPAPTRMRPPLSLLVPEVPPALAAAIEAGLAGAERSAPSSNEESSRPSAHEFASAIHRSGPSLAVDLSGAVHESVVPELLTRLDPPARRGVSGRRGAARSRSARDRLSGRRVGRRNGARDSGARRAGMKFPGRRRGGLPRAALAVGGATIVATIVIIAATAIVIGAVGPPGLGTGNTADKSADAGARSSATRTGETPAAARAPEAIAEKLQVGLTSRDPARAVVALAALRAKSFRTGDGDALERVNVAGSSAMRADVEILRQLNRRGHVLAGLTFTVTNAHVVTSGSPAASTPDRAVVDVTVATSKYVERARDGDAVRVVPAAPPDQVHLILHRVDGRWQIAAVTNT